MFKLFFKLFLLSLVSATTAKVSCLGPNGNTVDWWVIYKLPVITTSTDSGLQAGTGYAYYDSDSSDSSETAQTTSAGLRPLKGKTLADTSNNPLKHTLDQIYNSEMNAEMATNDKTEGLNSTTTTNNKISYLMYNDELPCSSSGGVSCAGSDTDSCMATCPFAPYTKYNAIGLGPSDCYSGKYDHSKCNVWYCSLQGTFFAHSKGTLALDKDSGFWLIHSLPRFPAPASLGASYRFQGCLGTYGQTYMCSSLDSESFDNVGVQLRHVGPLLYDTSSTSPNDLSASSFPNLQKVYDTFDRTQRIMNKTIFTQNRLRNSSNHYQNAVTLSGSTSKKTKFLHVATEETGSKVPHGLWDVAVPTALERWPSGSSQWNGKGLFVETWRKGSGPSNDGKVGLCAHKAPDDYSYDVVNVGEMKATLSKQGDSTFPFQKDHSKWAVTEGTSSPWICFGDKNRELSQDKRGGGAMCFVNQQLHDTFSESISVLGGDIWHSTKCTKGGKCSKATQTCVLCDSECAGGSSTRKEGEYYCDTQDTDCGLKPPGNN